MSREWQPGDVAVVWINDRCELALVRRRKEAVNEPLEFAYVSGGFDMTDDLAPGWNARPLVVIDPEDREQVERLRDLMLEAIRDQNPGTFGFSAPLYGNGLQAALREFADPKPPKPPKPDEPTGLGAVVEDAAGERWVRGPSHNSWKWLRADSPGCESYADIPAVKVLSEGVTP